MFKGLVAARLNVGLIYYKWESDLQKFIAICGIGSALCSVPLESLNLSFRLRL